jgi:ubiquinone/menaquinone biosynthesis C-methylase UbiE
MAEFKTVFDYQARIGLTMHLGSVPATRELVKLCQVLPGFRVLDVGSGAGRTPVLLAKDYGVQVVGVDLHPGMVSVATRLARQEKLEGKVRFRQGDAQALPFEDNSFDAVIAESVTAFVSDKQKAVAEYLRVVKPGGYVGINEATYLQSDPPKEIRESAANDLGLMVEPLLSKQWEQLMRNVGLYFLAVRLFPLNLRKQTSQTLKRYGVRGIAQTWGRSLGLYLQHPEARQIMRTGSDGYPAGLMDYLGYGLYIGRKPDGQCKWRFG